jgi:hypothetical protein
VCTFQIKLRTIEYKACSPIFASLLKELKMKSKSIKDDSKASPKNSTQPTNALPNKVMVSNELVSKSVNAGVRNKLSQLRTQLDHLISHIDENKLSYRQLEQFERRLMEHFLAHIASARIHCPKGMTYCPGQPDGGGGWTDGCCVPIGTDCETI